MHIILFLIFFSDTAPPAEPCASTPAPNIVYPPASLSSNLPANSASAPASNTAPPHHYHRIHLQEAPHPNFQEDQLVLTDNLPILLISTLQPTL